VYFFDALRVKIGDEGTVKNKAVYLALGLWVEQTEGSEFWLKVMTDLRNRGVSDMLIAVVDGLKGFPEAISSTFADAQIQTCIVHWIRHSLEFASWKDRKALAAELKRVYRATDATAAQQALEAFADGPRGPDRATNRPAGLLVSPEPRAQRM